MTELEPRLRTFVNDLLAAPAPADATIAELRAAVEADAPRLWGAADEIAAVEDRVLPPRVRVYRPAVSGPLPILVWFHGGGWVVGSIESHDSLCRRLAAATPCCVVAVGYRLAPEAPYPAAVEDAWAATAWVAAHAAELHGDPARIAVGGDSAGGNLAAIVALRARDRGLALGLQVLVYPVTDANLDSESYLLHAEGLNLTRAKMAWYWEQYIGSADPSTPEASPLRAETLRGVAPALVQTAEHDVLLSEGEAYAARLAADDVPVTCTRYEGVIHGFIRMPALTAASDRAIAEVAAAIRAMPPG